MSKNFWTISLIITIFLQCSHVMCLLEDMVNNESIIERDLQGNQQLSLNDLTDLIKKLNYQKN